MGIILEAHQEEASLESKQEKQAEKEEMGLGGADHPLLSPQIPPWVKMHRDGAAFIFSSRGP